MLRAIKASYDFSDKAYGLDILTNSPEHEGDGYDREIAHTAIFFGKLWVHINLYAKADGIRRVPRVWGISYEPGYGWLNSFGEKQIETVDELLGMIGSTHKANANGR